MGYDITTVNSDKYFRANIWGMQILRGAMDQAGCLDWDTQHAEWPEWDEEKEGDEEYEAEYDKEANKIKSFLSSDSDKVPGVKFCSNDGWIVTPEECNAIAESLFRLLDRKDKPLVYKRYELTVSDYVDKTASEDDLNFIKEFANFCQEASDDGGFKVY